MNIETIDIIEVLKYFSKKGLSRKVCK